MHLLPALLAAGPCPTCVQADSGTAGLESKGSCPDAPKPPTRPGKFKERRGLIQPGKWVKAMGRPLCLPLLRYVPGAYLGQGEPQRSACKRHLEGAPADYLWCRASGELEKPPNGERAKTQPAAWPGPGSAYGEWGQRSPLPHGGACPHAPGATQNPGSRVFHSRLPSWAGVGVGGRLVRAVPGGPRGQWLPQGCRHPDPTSRPPLIPRHPQAHRTLMQTHVPGTMSGTMSEAPSLQGLSGLEKEEAGDSKGPPRAQAGSLRTQTKPRAGRPDPDPDPRQRQHAPSPETLPLQDSLGLD